MADFDGGRVFLQVVPSFANTQRIIQAEARRWGTDAGREFRRAFEDQTNRPSNTNPGPSPTTSRRQGEESGGAFAQAFRARLEAATRALPPVRIGVATSQAEQELRDLRDDLESLSGKTVGVDIDAAAALAQVQVLQQRIEALREGDVDIDVDADAGAALAQLAAVEAEIRRLRGMDADVNVRANTDLGDLDQFTGRLLALGLAGASIAPAIVPAAAAAAAALVAIGAAASAGIAGIGVLALGLSGVGKAVKALGAAQQQTGKDSAAAGAAAASSAAAQASAARQVESAEASLANTRASTAAAAVRAQQSVDDARAKAVQAATDGAERIADAEQRLAEAIEDGARRVSDAEEDQALTAEANARRVEDARDNLATVSARAFESVGAAMERYQRAERDLADAQENSLRAQESLNEARQQAARDAEDLALDVESAGLRQRDAALGVEEAQLRLNETMADPKATNLQKRQAQLSYEQAVQQLEEIGVRYRRLQEEKAAADAAGIDGSDRVVDAQQRVIDAQRAASDAQDASSAAATGFVQARVAGDQAIADAAENVTRVEVEAARAQAAADRDLADAVIATTKQRQDAEKALADTSAAAATSRLEAERGVTDAVTAAAEQQRQAAFSVEQAQRGVESALAASAAAGAGSTLATSAAVNDLAEAMGNLSPAGRAFAEFIYGLKPALDGLRSAAAEALLPKLQTAIGALLPSLPAITGFVSSLAGVLGDLAIEAATALAGPEWSAFFGYLASDGGKVLTDVARGLGSLALGLANLMVAFAPVTDAFLEGFASIMASFAQWAADLAGSEGFQGFVDYLMANGPVLMETFSAIGGALVTLVQSMAPFAPLVLGAVTAVANFIAAIPPDVLGTIVLAIIALVTAFAYLVPMIISVVGAVGGFIAAVGAEGLGAALLGLLGPVGWVVLALIAVGVALVALWTHSETFRDIVKAAFEAVADAGVWLWENALQPAFEAIRAFVVDTLGPALAAFWTDYAQPAFEAIGAAGVWLWENAIKPAFGAFKTFVTDVLGPAISWFWTEVIQPAWTGIQIAISVAWVAIQIILAAFELFVRLVLAPVFTWLWEKIVQPAFSGIGSVISTVWTDTIKPVLEALGNFISDTVAPAFELGVTAIKTAWDKIKDAAKEPIRFVIEKVINEGIIAGFNDLAKLVPGVDPITPIKLPDGFARGGILPGSSTWRDGDDQLRPMRRGEGVAISEAMAVPALRNELLRWNRIGVSGGTSALAQYASTGGYARGGIVGGKPIGDGDGIVGRATDAVEAAAAKVKSALANPKAFLKKILDDLLAAMPGADTALGQIATGFPTKLISGLAGKFGAGGGDDGVGGSTPAAPASSAGTGSGSAWQAGVVKAMFPSAQITSGYRPGSITASGNLSYHARNRAVDIAPPNMGIFDALASAFPNTAELIYSPAGARQLKNGRSHMYTGAVKAMHYNHVHWAYDQGGYLPQGVTQVFNGTGKPEPVLTHQQFADMSTLAARGAAVTTNRGVQVTNHNTIHREVDFETAQRRQVFQLNALAGS